MPGLCGERGFTVTRFIDATHGISWFELGEVAGCDPGLFCLMKTLVGEAGIFWCPILTLATSTACASQLRGTPHK